ncbi:unnamed protein product [Spirodela intermedia]|uniref:histidine kinase n=1 Tax=Spirodela intermedia TaxID=51605 RepID=A0A7I8KQC6_SPIIN|nr:unnamed protein product [Spirodela intermedia]
MAHGIPWSSENWCGFLGAGESRRLSLCRQRRILRQEKQSEDLRYGSAPRCLSSYYSVFVARLAIMVMLAILIATMTILTWHFSKVYTTSSIRSLAYGLRYELLQRPILRMWNILNSTVEITVAQVKLSEYVIDRYYSPTAAGDQNPQLYEAMRNVTWVLFASRTALASITVSHRDGYVQAFHRDPRSRSIYYIFSAPPEKHGKNASSVWYRFSLDPATGRETGGRRKVPPDDLISIAGLSEVSDGTAAWRVAVSKFTDSPLLAAALPVRRPADGAIVAAVGVTTSLHSVGQLMRELVGFHSGHMYLTSREGFLLATSTDAPLLRNSTAGPALMQAADSDDRIIRAGAEWLHRAHGDSFPIRHEVHDENVKIGRQRYYVDSFFLDLKRLPLVGVTIIPRRYIMGKVDQMGTTTLIILVSVSVCVLAIGCVLIMVLTSGVSKEMRLRAELISHLDARRRAEASSNYKSQFLANMSHELRTPMAAVIGLLDLLISDDCLTNEQLETVSQIRKCSTALLRLLNSILDLSKVESGKLVLEEVDFDLQRELEGLMDMFSVQCVNHNMETVLDLSDDMPKVVRGDSARVVQIFTNLVSNSIKFTSSGHIILRGWCEYGETRKQDLPQEKWSQCFIKTRGNQDGFITKEVPDNCNRITLQFEVDDTGCGIDPSKWESVFESFEQADPSTTRMHGGTGLGLCIVRNLVNKMGGKIKVVKKDGPGTLMRLSLVLGLPAAYAGKRFELKSDQHNLMVLLAVKGTIGRSTIFQWLRKKGIPTIEASDWNALTQILQENLQVNKTDRDEYAACSESERLRMKILSFLPEYRSCGEGMVTSNTVIVVDTALLDLRTDIWEEQLNFLEKYRHKVQFAWLLSRDTSNNFKAELRRKGHFLLVNKPLYKARMVQILDAVLKERSSEYQLNWSIQNSTTENDLHECHEVDPIKYGVFSSESSDKTDVEREIIQSSKTEGEKVQVPHYPEQWTGNSVKESISTSCTNSVIQFSSFPGEDTAVTKLPTNVHDLEKYECGNRHMHSLEENEQCQVLEGNTKDDHRKASRISKPEIEPFKMCTNAWTTSNQVDQMEIKDIEQDLYKIDQVLTDLDGFKQQHPLCESESMASPHIDQASSRKNSRGLNQLSCRILKPDVHQVSKVKDSRDSIVDISCLRPLEGLCILLAEDTLILQRVATIMLQKMGAKVVPVGDGQQAVDALRYMLHEEERRRQTSNKQLQRISFDLILMDCQMPKMDGYEATKEIRRLEVGTGFHIPIVALTAHAMSSDEARCLEVGMDAYLTKPIDSKLMESTILSLTKSFS